MACVFYSMPILAENKPRLLYCFSVEASDFIQLTDPMKIQQTVCDRRELGGIPNSSEDIKQAHAASEPLENLHK
jgi:hypothetical protein